MTRISLSRHKLKQKYSKGPDANLTQPGWQTLGIYIRDSHPTTAPTPCVKTCRAFCHADSETLFSPQLNEGYATETQTRDKSDNHANPLSTLPSTIHEMFSGKATMDGTTQHVLDVKGGSGSHHGNIALRWHPRCAHFIRSRVTVSPPLNLTGSTSY
jgi:hypothetical protein